jgi:alpha-tubulin suppressor-like RCC1 family protein
VQVKTSATVYLADVTAVAAGGSHSVASKNDGTVWAWGYNYVGELGDGTTVSKTNPVQVKVQGGAALSGVSAISAKVHSTVSLKTDGTVWAWGSNGFGQLGDGTSGSGTNKSNPVKVLQSNGKEFNLFATSGGGTEIDITVIAIIAVAAIAVIGVAAYFIISKKKT